MQNSPTTSSLLARWGLAALLFAGMFLCYAQRGALSLAAPFLMQERHL